MTKYPQVTNESDTLDLVLAGRSIARYGDGELKFSRGGPKDGIKSQVADPYLSKRLREILANSGDCLVGIPNIHGVRTYPQSTDQKVQHWTAYLRFAGNLPERKYVSAFITRPDSAPWINTPEYWERLSSLWRGKDVTLVRGSGKSLTGERLGEWGAGTVTEIAAPRQHAWAEYDDIVKRVLAVKPKRVLICLGPTATVMAVDLCAKGIHAIDCGHVGMFYRKHVEGQPIEVTDEDKTPEAAVA